METPQETPNENTAVALTPLETMLKENPLPDTKAKILLEKFNHYFAMAAEWEKKIKDLEVTDVNQVLEMKMAGEIRKKMKKDRTAIENTRVKINEENQNEIKITNAICNVLKALITPLEEKASKIEKFAEIKAKEEWEQRQGERLAIAAQYGLTDTQIDLGSMSAEAWAAFESGLIHRHEEKQKAEAAQAAEDKRKHELQKDRLDRLLKFSFRIEAVDYNNLSDISDEDWVAIIKKAEQDIMVMDRYNARVKDVLTLGFKSKDPSFYSLGSMAITDGNILEMSDQSWKEWFEEAVRYVETIKKASQRQNELVGMGFSYNHIEKMFVKSGFKIEADLLTSSTDEDWKTLMDTSKDQLRKIDQYTTNLAIVRGSGFIVVLQEDGFWIRFRLEHPLAPWPTDNIGFMVNLNSTDEDWGAVLAYLNNVKTKVHRKQLFIREGWKIEGEVVMRQRPWKKILYEEIAWMDETTFNEFFVANQVEKKMKQELDAKRRARLLLMGHKEDAITEEILDMEDEAFEGYVNMVNSQLKRPVMPAPVPGVGLREQIPSSNLPQELVVKMDWEILRDFANDIEDIKLTDDIKTPRGQESWKNIQDLRTKFLVYIRQQSKLLTL